MARSRALFFALGLSLLLWADAAWAAFGAAGSFCDTSTKTSSNPWTFTTTAQLDAGNLGIIVLATDNLSEFTTNTGTHNSIADAAGNTWTRARGSKAGNGGLARQGEPSRGWSFRHHIGLVIMGRWPTRAS